jgi:TolB-like protein/tetratricopeptide (TPR) repeat protein
MKTELDTDSVRGQLDRILGSMSFDASRRNRQFLKFVVEETLEGRSDRIKAYTIATIVFGRDDSFDPQSDSIVRIEAGRLRRSIERYYLTAGLSDSVRIEIGRGSYVPSFSALPTAAPRPEHGRLGHAFGEGPAIFVTPFEVEDDQSALPNFTAGFTRQVIVALARFRELFVFGPETSFSYAPGAHRAEILTDLDVDFILTGGTTIGPHRFEVEALLIEARTGRYIWAESFERSIGPPDLVVVRDEIANTIARILAQPYGVIFCNAEEHCGAAHSENLTGYDLVVRSYQYARTFDRSLFEPVRAGLERVVLRDPHYADAFARLSVMYVDAFRFRHDVSAVTADPLGRAQTLAHRAMELAPQSSHAHYALALVHWFRGDPPGALAVLERSLAANPNDTKVLAELGLRHAMLGDSERAENLLRASFYLNAGQPAVYRMGMFWVQLARGNYAEALAEARGADAPDFVHSHAAVAIAAALLGRRQEAEIGLQALLQVDPDYGDHAIADLNVRSIQPDLSRLWLDGLRKAGLLIPTDSPRTTLRAV